MLKERTCKWTEEEINYLLDNYGRKKLYYLSNYLKRSENAIRLKMKELTGTMDLHESSGMLAPKEVSKVFSVDVHTIIYWIENYSFPAYRQYRGNERLKGTRYYIDPDLVWDWAYENQEIINFSSIQRGIILPEPDWLDKRIYHSVKIKPPKCWSQEEKDEAFKMWQNGVNYRIIAKKLNRPLSGTQRVLTKIRKSKNVKHIKTKKIN